MAAGGQKERSATGGEGTWEGNGHLGRERAAGIGHDA